jgi:hypothetical protein
MKELTDFGREYLLLGLRISKYLEEKERLKLPPEKRENAEIDKYAEAYFGPKELQNTVKKESIPNPRNLLASCKSLQAQLKDQGFEAERSRFLKKMLGAIKTKLEIELGEDIPYLEQVRKLYDISPTLVDDSIFFQAKEKIDELYEGTGSLLERATKVGKSQEIPKERIMPLYNSALNIVRDKTKKLFPDLFPEKENVTFRVVKEKDWSAYNWYLGNYSSRIEINTNLPVRWTSILFLSAHEGYPGHHTEHTIKDYLLYHQQKRFEHSILLINTPEAVICEGIATCAVDVLYFRSEAWEIALEHLCPAKLNENIEMLIERSKLYKNLNKFSSNLAIHRYADGWSNKELLDYMMQFELWTENECKERLKFISNPLWSTFIFTYSEGEKLIKQKFGERPSPQDFSTLLTRPILPSDLI